jgi:phosphatidylglycerol:prolipoprotein diacylglycerol transferase
MLFFADAYFHTLDPFLVRFPASWPIAGIRWYGTAYAIGFLIAWWMIRIIARRQWSQLQPSQVGDLMFAAIVGVLLGGRLGYALFYDRELFYTFSKSMPYWNLLAINRGGMASRGGMIGVILAMWWFAARRGISVLHVLDIGSLASAPGLCLGRIANFINGELHGRPIPNQANPPWWSMKFPHEMTEWGAAKLQTLTDVVELVNVDGRDLDDAVKAMAQQPGSPPPEAVAFTERVVQQLIDATQHHHAAVIEALRPKLTAFYPSQLIQAFTDGPLLLGFLVLIWLKPRKPGVIGSWFLISYGLMRIASEFFRQPDVGVPLMWGLSRGQILSLFMVIAGAMCLIITLKRDVARLGGLFSGPAKASS